MAESDSESVNIKVRSREDESVPWSRKAARRSGTLKNFMDDIPDGDDYPVELPAADLGVLAALSEDEPAIAALATMSFHQLQKLAEGANFLDAAPALAHIQSEVAARLDGMSAEEMRTAFGAEDDLSDEARAAALAEPAFMPEFAVLPPVPPPLQSQPSLSGLSVSEDAKVLALGKVEEGTLLLLKGVNQSWGSLARRMLCSRICRHEGQPSLGDITDLDVERLAAVGRAWDVSIAGTRLPNLARLHGFGFEIDVIALRDANVAAALAGVEPGRSDTEERLRLQLRAALRGCTTGEGTSPDELNIMALACAASGVIRGVPVDQLRENHSIGELDLSRAGLGVLGAQLLGLLLPRATSIISLKYAANPCPVHVSSVDRPSVLQSSCLSHLFCPAQLG